MLADKVEAQAVERDMLALHVDDHGSATALAEELESLEALPEPVRQRVEGWLARDREWQEMAAVARLVDAPAKSANPAARREAAGRPAVAEAIRREINRLARLPETGSTVGWTGEEPLVPGDRLRAGSGAGMIEAVLVSAGAAGGLRPDDELQLRVVRSGGPNTPLRPGELVAYTAGSLVLAGCERAAWSDERLRELELARHESVPAASCRLACTEPVRGDRIVWTETAGEDGQVRTIEAMTTLGNDIFYGSARLDLEVLDASGPGAPESGGAIERTVAAVTARGCFRAEWADEARRERILDPPKLVPAPRQTQQLEQTQEQWVERSEGGGLSAG